VSPGRLLSREELSREQDYRDRLLAAYTAVWAAERAVRALGPGWEDPLASLIDIGKEIDQWRRAITRPGAGEEE